MRRGLAFAIIATAALGTSTAHAGALGDFISSNVQSWYGNTTNPRPDGHGVLPSLAPGPWKCIYDASGACVGETYGGSVGEWITPILSNGKSKADFANGGIQPGDCTSNPEPKPGTTTGCPVP